MLKWVSVNAFQNAFFVNIPVISPQVISLPVITPSDISLPGNKPPGYKPPGYKPPRI